MTDIQQLTLVIGCVGLIIAGKMPEPNPEKYESWGLVHLTFVMIIWGFLIAGVLLPIFYILGLIK